MTDPMVEAEWLVERLGAPDLSVIDASWFMPGNGRDARAEFAEGHVPGAVFFGIDEVCDQTSEFPHMLATPGAFGEAMRALGVGHASTVVVYDSQGVFSAPRLWWNLRVMGNRNARVLNGGLPAWRAAELPLEKGWPTPRPGNFQSEPDLRLARNLDAMKQALDDPPVQIVDARPSSRFRGEAPEPRPGLRAGHMPRALNIPFDSVLENGRLAPAGRLENVIRTSGVNLADPIVTTCGSGISAALLALAFARVGREDVAVYDGSWSEWGGRSDTPVVTGQ